MKIFLVTRRYADAVYLKKILPWEKLGHELLIEMNPPSALQKLRECHPDILMLFGMLDNTHFDLYLDCVQKNFMRMEVVVLPTRQTELNGQEIDSTNIGNIRVHFVPLVTERILLQVLSMVQQDCKVQKPVIKIHRKIDIQQAVERLKQRFPGKRAILCWLHIEPHSVLVRKQWEDIFDTKEREDKIVWSEYSRHNWLLLVREEGQNLDELLHWFRDTENRESCLLVGKRITQSELEDELERLKKQCNRLYFRHGERIIHIDRTAPNSDVFTPAKLAETISSLMISTIQGEEEEVYVAFRTLYLRYVKHANSFAVLCLVRQIIRKLDRLWSKEEENLHFSGFSGLEEECEMLCKRWKENVLHRKEPEVAPLLAQTISFLYNNYGNPISIQMVADDLGISETSLSRRFKKAVGCSVITVLLHMRIWIAALLLIEGRLSVGQIASLVGFADAKYFSRIFRQLTGNGPAQYKNAMQQLEKGEAKLEECEIIPTR